MNNEPSTCNCPDCHTFLSFCSHLQSTINIYPFCFLKQTWNCFCISTSTTPAFVCLDHGSCQAVSLLLGFLSLSPPTRLPPVIHPQCISNQDSSRLRSFQFSSVAQSWLTLCNPMNCSTPGLPVHTNSLSSPKLIRSFSGSLLFLADPLEKTLMLGKIKSKRRRGRQDEIVR